MSRKGLLVTGGMVAFLVFLVALVPASLLTRWLPPDVVVTGLDGTIWSGRASSVSVRGRAMGAASWSCRPWPLLAFEWSCRVELRPGGGTVSGWLSGELNGPEIDARDLSGQLPITYLEGIVTPKGWTGQLDVEVAMARIAGGLPQDAEGRIVVRGLKAPGPGGAQLGDFELTIGEGAVGTETLTGRLSDLGGPLRVRGTAELKRDRSYFLSGEVSPGPGAGPEIFDTLGFLGP
ncbi:MAG: type II secretion system protein N, partial [Steroidobacteraceae bacterium]